MEAMHGKDVRTLKRWGATLGSFLLGVFFGAGEASSVPLSEKGLIPLILQDRSSAPPGLWPCQAGVPFPSGMIKNPGKLHLSDSLGRSVPIQTSIQSLWPDGSLRWVSLDFQTDGRRAGGAFRLLTDQENPERESNLILEDDHGYHANTGVLSFFVSNSPETPLLQDLRVFGQAPLDNPTGLELSSILGGETALLRWGRTRKLSFTKNGPIKGELILDTVLSDSRGTARLGASIRIHLYQGLPVLHLEIRIFAPRSQSPVDRLTVRLTPRVKTGMKGLMFPSKDLRPLFSRDRMLDSAQKSTALRGTREGRCSLLSGGIRMDLYHPLFEERAPRRLRISESSGIELDLITTPTVFPTGSALTEDVLIRWTPERRASRTYEKQLRLPLLALPSSNWLQSADALEMGGHIGHREDILMRRCRSFLDREEHGSRGAVNFGDWRMGADSFGNHEFDTLHGCLVAGLRTRERKWIETATHGLRHWLDLDQNRRPPWTFLSKTPMILPFPHGPGHRGGPVEAGHVWVEGALQIALLTADPFAISDVAIISKSMVALSRTDHIFERERNLGWTLIALSSISNNLGTSESRETLNHLSRRCKERAATSGVVLLRQLESSGPESEGAFILSTWVSGGILCEGYYRAYRETRNPEFRNRLLKLANVLAESVSRKDPRNPGTYYNSLVLEGRTGKVISRRGTVAPENLLLMASGLSSVLCLKQAPGNIESLVKRMRARALKELLTIPASELTGPQVGKILRSLPLLSSRL